MHLAVGERVQGVAEHGGGIEGKSHRGVVMFDISLLTGQGHAIPWLAAMRSSASIRHSQATGLGLRRPLACPNRVAWSGTQLCSVCSFPILARRPLLYAAAP